ncbi:tetratricopeptide repeat protein [Humisphaera borealis]|uniref:Tetratricopeptide repeat protein n=1 Tax=Humisphaera borealis TaxID=2807512 RepID=A0A7M2X1V0_9BACT|nr:tetratricopeptide repeat protein [Humisphaera borealis]QOV91111.1 tetratricopeptide repeat protein [Humisphaera borealis]
MSRNRVRAILVAAVLSCGMPAISSGQEVAGAAFKDGVTAFNAGQFDKARELFATASQTDNKNPEVYLWLGKAEYQLGQVDAAVAAWQKTSVLAPNEPYAKQMLKVLTGQKASADTTLSIIEALLKDELWDSAVTAADRLLADRALTDSQRAKASILRMRGLLPIGKTPHALTTASELLVTQPAMANDPELRTLIGLAKVRTNDSRVLEGLETLRDVVAKNPNTPSAALAEFELLNYDLSQSLDAAKVAALAKWIADHPTHEQLPAARRRLIDGYLALASVGGEPRRDAVLSPSDLAAIEATTLMYKQVAKADEAVSLTNRIVNYLNERYEKFGAVGAAKAGAEALLKSNPTSSSRLITLRADARYSMKLAIAELEALVAAGQVKGPAGQLPAGVAEVLRVFAAINKEPAGGGAWKEQAAMAEQIRQLAAQIPWGDKPTALKPLLDWSVQVALPVVKDNADTTAVAMASRTIAEVGREVPVVKLALSVNTPLLAALSPDRPEWAEAAWRQVDLLNASAVELFRDNVAAGKAADNAKLSQPQQDLIAVLGEIVKRQVSAAPRAFDRLNSHLLTWTSANQHANAEAAYAQLAGLLPATQKQQVDLALVNLWIRQAIDDENRLTAAGLAVGKDVDARLLKAAQRLYELQADRSPTDPYLQQVRSLSLSIVNHYAQKKDFAAARTIASAKPQGAGAKPSPAGDTFAQFQLARLSVDAARRELADQLSQFGGSKVLALSDAMKAAIAAHTKFIADHPTDPLAEQSAQAVLAVADTYQQQGAFDAAAQIYRDLATFAAGKPALSQATPISPSLEERAAFAAIGAMENKARASLQASRAAEKGEITPPTKITDDYTAALAAYETYIKARPDSALVGAAIGRVMAMALDWTRVDAWDVADGVYAVLLKPELKIRDPERLEFARGMCQIGKVMPDHAREVLTALTSGRQGVSPDSGLTVSGVAMAPTTPVPGGVPPPAVSAPVGSAFGGGIGASGPASTPMPETAATGKPMSDAGAFGGDASKFVKAEDSLARADREVIAAISAQEARRSAMIAQLRDAKEMKGKLNYQNAANQPQEMPAQQGQQRPGDAPPVLSEAEIARQSAALESANKIFRDIRKKYAATRTAEQSRGEIMVIVGHWRANGQWQRAAEQARAFLTDNPKDAELPRLRLAIAQDTLAWAGQSVDPAKMGNNRQLFLAEVSKRFDAARAEFARIVAEFPDERQLRLDAQWQLATSFLTQAHTVGNSSPTLARGQYVRAVKEMQRAAGEYYDHPQVQTIPQILWDISQELTSRGFHEEAISVWNDLVIQFPANPLAQQAAQQMAASYQSNLGRPLRAAEVYLEINFARGGADPAAQNAIYQIGASLKQQSRWVEALHVLGTFVASFPRHPEAGQALTMIGQIHQTNEAWADAIEAYKRVTIEYASNGQWVQEARWAIAECTLNLSLWREAIGAYQSFVNSYPKDPRVAEANRRTGILKDIAKYQQLVDENGPKAFDAQFQIATITQGQLGNPTKAVGEFRKVAQKWPGSHLADDALYQVGLSYLSLNRTGDARDAMAVMARTYPESPLADDALLAIGKSYEEEAQQIAGYTREQQFDLNKDVQQKQAYGRVNSARVSNRAAQQAKIQELRQGGKGAQAELEEARGANDNFLWDQAAVNMAATKAQQDIEAMTCSQLADKQDKINVALRKAVESYAAAGKVPGADKAGEALLRVATIYGERLNDSQQAMATWLEIVRQFSGTAVAEEASWRIAQNYERDAKYAEAIDAYKSFLRNYRGSNRAADAQFAVAENYEHLNEWVKAMDSYGNYVNSFPQGPMIEKAKEQITWIKTYRL